MVTRTQAYRLLAWTLLCLVVSCLIARKVEAERRMVRWSRGYAVMVKVQAAESLRAQEVTRRALASGDASLVAQAEVQVDQIEAELSASDEKLLRWLEAKPKALTAEERAHLAVLRGESSR